MDPTARTNALRQYMDFYKQNMGNPNAGYSTPWDTSGFNPTHFDTNQSAMNFAQQQVSQDPGNVQSFYGGQTPQYTPPQSVQSMQSIAGQAGFPLAPQDQPQVMRRPQVNAGDMAMNYLRNLFTR